MTSIRTASAVLTLLCVIVLAGCSTTSRTKGGGYYKDDGPGTNIPSRIDAIPDAVPRIETHSRSTMKPYVVFGKRYVPVSDERPFRQEGTASWYGKKFHGNKTANGETYDMYGMTAAHPTLPLPSYARVTHATTGKSVIVRINDRGPFHSNRIMDLSYVAAAKLGLIGPGSGQIIIEAITNADIARGAGQPAQAARAAAPGTSVAARPVAFSSQPLQARPAAITNATAQPTPDALAAIGSTPSADAILAEPASASQSPSNPPSSDMATSGGIYLQFGAFSGSDTAQQLAQKLNRQIAQVESRSATVQTAENLHRVRIGPYPNRTEAVNAALRIQQETGMQPGIALR